MKKFFPLITIALGLFATSHATIRYVNINATGANNGTSWADAYTSLQSALSSLTDTVWVANGVYKPTTTTDRTIAFSVVQPQKLFGGFAGTETSLSQRNYSTYQTVLSGDIGIVGDSTDNSYNVVKKPYVGISVPDPTLLDGFKIAGGNANSATASFPAYQYGAGGAVYIDDDINIRNCLFENNYAANGGAIGSGEFPGIASVINCKFLNNRAGSGGAIFFARNQITIKNSSFSGNKAAIGGCVYTTAHLSGTSAYFTGCTFTNNQATSSGGVSFMSAHTSFNACTFSGNQAHIGGVLAASLNGSGSPITGTFNNCLIAGNTADSFSVADIGPFSASSNPVIYQYISIYNCTIAHNKALNNEGKLLSVNTASTIQNSILWNNANINNVVPTDPIKIFLNGGGPNTAPIIQTNIIENTTLANNFSADPLFINPGNVINAPFDAVNYNYRLDTLSPAIDTGNNAGITANATDLAGNPRIQGLKVDLGAYERSNCTATISGDITVSGGTYFCPGSSVTLTAPTGGMNYIWSNGATSNSITVTTAGNYMVSVFDTAGCIANFQKDIYVYQTPVVTITGPTVLCQNNPTILVADGNNGGFSFVWSNGVTTDSNIVTVPGDYYVVGTSPWGCIDTSDIINIQPTTQPTVVNIIGDTILCGDESTTLTVTGNATSFIWMNSPWFTENILDVDQPGIFYVTGKDDFGCTASDTVQVISIPLPSPIITQNGNTLETSSFSSYQWIEGNTDIPGATTQTYTPTATGIYRVRVTNAEGCEGVSEPFNFTLTGIHETYDQSGLQVYPNPAKDHLTIDVSNLKSKVESYTIYDIIGKAVILKDKVNVGQAIQVDLPSSLANGNYILQLNTAKEAFRAKFTIKR